MPKAYSGDLRERVIEAVETGASRREAAERFEVSGSSAVKWLQRWRESKSAAPKPRGGSISPLEEFATEILALVAEQPDLALVETVSALAMASAQESGLRENCTNRLRGRAPRRDRVIGSVPLGAWEAITFVAALRHNKMTAPRPKAS